MAWPCHPARAGQQSGAQCGLGSVSSGQGSGKRVRRRHPREPKAARSFGVSVCHVWALPRGSLWAGGAPPPPARPGRASVPRMCCAHHGANVAHALRASATTQKAAGPSRRLARCCTRAAPRGCGRARAAAAACKDGARGAASLWGLRWARGRRLWRPPTAVAAANHHIPRSPQLAAAESGRHAKRSVI